MRNQPREHSRLSTSLRVTVLFMIKLFFTHYTLSNSNLCFHAVATSITDEKQLDPECKCHPHDGNGGKIAYLITLHNPRTLIDAQALFQSIVSPRNIVIIHIDKKLQWSHYVSSPLRNLVEQCNCGAQVYIDSVYDCVWGSWNMMDPLHWAMSLLTNSPRFKGKWDVFMNLSADSFPIFTPNVMSKLFDPSSGPLAGINFVTSSSCVTGLRPTDVTLFPSYWHKRSHYLTHPHKPYTIQYLDDKGHPHQQTLVIHFGSQWMSLTPNFVEYLVVSLAHEYSLASAFRNELIEREKLMPDETFIPTLLSNDPYWNSTLPQVADDGSLINKPDMFHIRFERMDENTPSAFGDTFRDQHYDVPQSSKADVPRPWGPYYLGVYDLAKIKTSGAIFMRKVSSVIDPNMHQLFPVEFKEEIPFIQWPEEIKLIDKPEWNDPTSLDFIGKGQRHKKKLLKSKSAITVDTREL